MAPKIVTQGIPASLKRGEDYKLKCEATGNPLPDVLWRRNGVRDPRQQVRNLESKQIVFLQRI